MKKILILFGGNSYEHDISVRSSKTIFDNIDRDRYEVSACGLSRDGEFFEYLDDISLLDSNWLNKNVKKVLNVINYFINDIIQNNIDIDIFVNNAGVFHMPKSQTKDGLELTIGTNFIGVKYLNDLLKDYLLSLKHQVEVIFTTSVASYRGRINYDDFMLDKKYNKFRSYCNSKLCVTHYFIEYIKEVENTNIKTYLTHPGTTYTPLIKKAYPGIFGSIAKVGMRILFHLPNKACLGMVLALEKQKDHAYYAPRGLLEVSGYPKEVKIRKRLYKNQDKTIKISTEIIQKCKANN